MVENNSYNFSKSNKWIYLPDVNTLCSYINRAVLMHLSIASRNYRNQLNTVIFEKLRIVRFYTILPNKEIYGDLDWTDSPEVLIKALKADLVNKCHLTREATFYDAFNLQFAKKFVELFPNIKILNFSDRCYVSNVLSLETLINESNQIEKVEFRINRFSRNFQNSKPIILSKSLKFIKINIENYARLFLPMFDSIDSGYTNLKFLSITSNKMLTNLSKPIPNLKQVEILNNWDLKNLKLIDFIIANPQLVKLETKFKLANKEVFEKILASKCLISWSITKCLILDIESAIFPINYSIKKLKLSGGTNQETVIKLINACQNLESIEFENWNHWFKDEINWTKLNKHINHLIISDPSLTTSFIRVLDNLKFFNQATLIYKYDTYHLTSYLGYGKLHNYRIAPSTPLNSDKLTITLMKI